MTETQAIELLIRLKSAYAGSQQRLDQREVAFRDQLYLEEFRSWSFASGDRAVRAVIRSSHFFPTIAELVTAYDAEILPHPERQRALLVEAPGHTTASPAEWDAALAKIRELERKLDVSGH